MTHPNVVSVYGADRVDGQLSPDQVGYIDANTRAIFGRSYAAEPDVLVKELAGDEAIKVAATCGACASPCRSRPPSTSTWRPSR